MEKINLKHSFSDKELDNYKKETYNDIVNDKEFYEKIIAQGFKNEDILKYLSSFDDYHTDFKNSKILKTYEDCEKANIYKALILVKDGDFIEKEYEYLPPVKAKLAYEAHFIYRDFPNEYYNLDMKKIKDPVIEKIKAALKKDKWLYFYGGMRSGRTYTASALINSYVNKYKDFSVAFIDCPNRFNKITSLLFSYNIEDKEEGKKIITSLQTCDLLVLDDFGSEYKNDFIRDNILLPIINKRMENNKKTIFTSDYSIKDVCTLYSLNKDIGKIVSKRLKDLLESKTGGEIEFIKENGLH